MCLLSLGKINIKNKSIPAITIENIKPEHKTLKILGNFKLMKIKERIMICPEKSL